MKKSFLTPLIISILLHALLFLYSIEIPEYIPQEIKELDIEIEKVEEVETAVEPEVQTATAQIEKKEATSIPIDQFMSPTIEDNAHFDANEDFTFNLFEDDEPERFQDRTHTASTYAKRNRDTIAPDSHIIDYDVHDIHESLGDNEPIKIDTKKFSKTKQDTIFISFTGTSDFFKDASFGGDDSLIRSLFAGKEFNPSKRISQMSKIYFEIRDGRIKGSLQNLEGNSELAIWVIEILQQADQDNKLKEMKSGVYVLEYRNKLVDINQQ